MSATASTMFDEGRVAQTNAATTGELFDRELILKYMAAGAFWLVFAPTVGAIVAIKFHYYDFLGHISWLTWGRPRPEQVPLPWFFRPQFLASPGPASARARDGRCVRWFLHHSDRIDLLHRA